MEDEAGEERIRVPFPRAAVEREDVKQLLIEMSDVSSRSVIS
jgi:hypothetical protein